MNSTPDTPQHDGSDLAELRAEIDELKKLPPTEDTLGVPETVGEEIPEPEPTDAIGSEDWDAPSPRPHDEPRNA